jgi:limonene-1,2-epoxide hydrolase
MSSAEQVVRDFCAAASTRDPAVLRAYFSDDVVYHNIAMDPAEGIDATMAVI